MNWNLEKLNDCFLLIINWIMNVLKKFLGYISEDVLFLIIWFFCIWCFLMLLEIKFKDKLLGIRLNGD